MKREGSWDFVKTILMFFIVFGHLCPSDPDIWTPVTRVIGLFAIPLFFFISGYFLSKVENFKSLIDRYHKSCYRIIVPLLSWGVIYVILSTIKMVIVKSYSIVDVLLFLKYTPYYIMGFYWFLTALIFCQIIGPFFSLVICNHKNSGCFILSVSCLFFCLLPPTLLEHYHFSFVWFFYCLGMLYHHFGRDFVQKSYNFPIRILLLIMTITLLLFIGIRFMPSDTFYYRSNLVIESQVSFLIQRVGLYFSVSLLMLFWIIQFYRRYKNKIVVQTYTLWGQDTLFIYCSHMLFVDFIHKPILLPLLFHENGSSLEHIQEHFIGLIMSLSLYCILQYVCMSIKRFKLVKRLFMGIK